MSIFDTLENRHHILKYKPIPIPDKTVKELLYKAWKVSPSKNNFMPYQVNVLGPNRQEEKNIIWDKVMNNNKFYDDLGLQKDTKANPKMKIEYKFVNNPNYFHVRQNSHLLVISQRVCKEPNEFYKRMVRIYGHYAEQCEIDEVIPTAESTSFEVGLFAAALTALCIEQKIDISYCACFPKNEQRWQDTPYVWYDKENKLAKVHIIMSMGYSDVYRYEFMKTNGTTDQDIKPEMEEIIKWI
jgi:hypothetical protein